MITDTRTQIRRNDNSTTWTILAVAIVAMLAYAAYAAYLDSEMYSPAPASNTTASTPSSD